ncbi:hypothetical protein HY383_00030 [Candidatus Daviesbacteria bacterium]|nr:hypothetical protein [Candidatus Daviesbacteria bacterium]
MTEAKGGYFDEAFVRVVMANGWQAIPAGLEVDVHDPTLQRKIARQSILRACGMFYERGINPVEVFCRYIPSGDHTEQIRWEADFANDTDFARASRFYSALVDFEGEPDTEEVITFIDNFCQEELCSTNQ